MTETSWVGSDFVGPPRSPQGIALCGSCQRQGRCQLGLDNETLQDDGSVVTMLTCGREHEGGPNVAHGGWTAHVLDELVGHVSILHHVLAVTGRLSVEFVKPVPVERPLRGHAWLVREEGHRRYVNAELTLAATGAVLARAEAIMVRRDRDHFIRHAQWLAEQDRLARRE